MTPREHAALKWGTANAVLSVAAAAGAIVGVGLLVPGSGGWEVVAQAAVAAAGTTRVHLWSLRQARAELRRTEAPPL